MKKKVLILIIFVTMMFINISGVLANCDDCSTSNCADCGCTLNSSGTACVYANYDNSMRSCGEGLIEKIPSIVPKTVSIIYKIIQIAVPVVLVIFGMMDLFKGITAQKEDEIKKGQQLFIKRLIVAALIFFMFVIVKVVISVAADATGARIIKCTECFIENKCDGLEYRCKKKCDIWNISSREECYKKCETNPLFK